MNKSLLLSLVLVSLFARAAYSQLLNLPESAVYDSLYNRYLVSNWSNGRIIQIDTNGVQSIFVENEGDFAGLCLVGDTVYAACQDEGVRGYNLHTCEEVMNREIPGSMRLNDITADNSGNLYLSDTQAHIIVRVPINSPGSSIFVNYGLNIPNGLLFDEPNNRLILVSARNNSPIQAISLADSSMTYIRGTLLDILDGLTRDEQGNYYVSSWGTNSVYRFNSDFTIGPELISTHGNSPADIFFNKHDNTLAVPIYYEHNIDFVSIEPTAIDEYFSDINGLPNSLSLSQNYPNPFNAATVISFDLPESQHVSINIYNILGQHVFNLFDNMKPAGEHSLTWDADKYPSGMYFYRLRTREHAESKKMLLLK